MSGGIKYRLSPQEYQHLADRLRNIEAVRARLKGTGIDVKLQDTEAEVSVEEMGNEVSYEITYPLDNDLAPGNGRIYLKDTYRLNRHDGKLLTYNRSVTQKPDLNEKIPFWVGVARRDHPREKITSHPEHLEKFLKDLSGLENGPKAGRPPMKAPGNDLLAGLHRPFPNDSKALVDANFAVFTPVRDAIRDFGLRLKFGDPQSGLSIRTSGGKLWLSLQLVLDTDTDAGLEAENNGRIYQNDVYEIDAVSGKVLSVKRSFTPSKASSQAFDKAIDRLNALNPLPADLPELETLTQGWLVGLGLREAKAPELKPKIPEPADPFSKALWRFHRLTGETSSSPQNLFPENNSETREAIHRTLALLLSGDQVALEKEAAEWETNIDIDPIGLAVLRSLLQLSQQDTEAAQRTLDGVPRENELGRRVQGLIDMQSRSLRLTEGWPLLELALEERMQRVVNEDRAWMKGIDRAWSGESSVNPAMRQVAVEGFLRRLKLSIEEGGMGFEAAIEKIEGDGPFEKEVKALLRNDSTLRELSQVLDETDNELRQDGLVHLARKKLSEENGMPATGLSIAERYSATDPKAMALQNWLNGKASFGQKFESALGHFNREVANPLTLGTMMLAGSAGKVGKLAFVNYLGNSRLGLKIGAEALSVGLESLVFVGGDKLYRSAFHSPAGVWDHPGRDFFGALLAFGVLRGGGLAGRRLQASLRDSQAWEAWLQGRTKIAWAEKPLEFAVGLGKAEGRGAIWKQRAGQTLAVPLRYASETGLPRAWLKPTAHIAASHGLTLASLMTANSLSRFAGLRPGSPQGWKADLVDDALMYGHFHVSGQLLQRMGPGHLDYRLAALENGPPVPGSRNPNKLISPPPQGAPEATPRFKIPPGLRESMRELTARLTKTWQNFRSKPPSEPTEGAAPVSAPSSSRLALLRSWLKSWGEGLSGLRLPWRRPKPVPVPAHSGPPLLTEGALAPRQLSSPDTLPPPASESTPPSARLVPTPLAIPFRFVPGKAKAHIAVSLTGHEYDREVLPVSKNTVNYECILGREVLQARPEAVGIDFGFPSAQREIEPQHAKISYQVKLKLTTFRDEKGEPITLGVPDKTTATIENLAKSSATYVNGKRVKSATLKSGDLIRFGEEGPSLVFHQDTPESAPTFTRAFIPLPHEQSLWSFGRESLRDGSPDIPFPMSSRDISTKQAQILRDAEGNYFLQDQGRNHTLVNGQAVYGTRPLQDGDLIRFGEQNEFKFHSTKIENSTDSLRPLSPHPRAEIPAPAQAERHPMFRGMSPEDVQLYFQRLGESDNLPIDSVRAASLETPDGRPLLMMTQYTGWAMGGAGENPATARLAFREIGKVEANPFLVYLDGNGQFILKPLSPLSDISVQGRVARFWDKDVPPPEGPRQKVEGWTRLRGGERIFSGDEIYFDFWPFSPPVPEFSPPSPRATIPDTVQSMKDAPVAETAPLAEPAPRAQPLLTSGGSVPLQVRNNLILSSDSHSDTVEIQLQADGMKVSVPVKIAKTTVFREGDSWKIHSEGGGEVPLLVNGIPLPSNIPLPLAPNSELSIGGLRFKLEFLPKETK